MTVNEEQQVKMHADFFDRCKVAIDNGFYYEAILMEYAAIESRLEVLCGILGLPCGKKSEFRKDIAISSRIECLRVFCNRNADLLARTKIPPTFFAKKGELQTWIGERNRRVHGLYKDEVQYSYRTAGNQELATQGEQYARLLYNEVKRLRRLQKIKQSLFVNAVLLCKVKNCKARKEPD